METQIARRRLILASFSAGLLPVITACGGGGGGDSGGGGSSGGQAPQLAAGTLVGAVTEVQERYPGVVSPALASELSAYSVAEGSARPGQTRSAIQGSWLGSLDRAGMLRVNVFNVVNQSNAAFPANADLRTGYTDFTGISVGTGKGAASVRNARDNLRVDSGSLQSFVGFRKGATQEDEFPGIDALAIIVFGEVTNGQNPVGVALSIWDSPIVRLEGVIEQGNAVVNRFSSRYRQYVLRDYSSGPTGLSLDYDVVMQRTG